MKKSKPVLNSHRTDDAAEITLYGTIGGWEGITAQQFRQELSGLGDVSNITLNLSSGGGDVFDGQAIYTSLKKHPANVRIEIDALAASAATVVAMAGDEIAMAHNALFMIHDPFTFAYGTSDEMLKTAEMLDQVTTTIVDVYADRTGLEKEQIRDWMQAETFFSAEEASEHHFVTELIDNKQVAFNACDFQFFRNMPDAVKNQLMNESGQAQARLQIAKLRAARRRLAG